MPASRQPAKIEAAHPPVPSDELGMGRWPVDRARYEEVANAFNLFRELCEGAMVVDADARIAWIEKRYLKLMSVPDHVDPVGLPVEDLIPNSRMRHVVETGRPIFLDIMTFADRQFVVCRIPLRDEDGAIQGAIGFVFYDNVDYLEPILKKFETLHKRLSRAEAALDRERMAKYSLANFVGISDAVANLKMRVRRFALRDGPALILGETGTGKELLAHAIHQASDRARGPFVAINMAAVPETLLESEFFGVAPGAFTGADKKARKGKFELAHGGTLFLDEIGDMPLAIQAKFLRVLQEGEIEPLGSNTVKKIDVRIIAATSQNLEKLIADGQFRADLYYRIAVLTLEVPPLAARINDIPLLVERFLEDIPRPDDQGAWIIPPEAIALLQAHHWPGNVRELRNVLERAAAMAMSEVLDADLIAEALPQLATVRPAAPVAEHRGTSLPVGTPLADRLAEAEKRALVEALEATDGRKSAAATHLGISRSQLYEKLRRHGLMD